jgi:tetratricopeptide (TPR) repeat protein
MAKPSGSEYDIRPVNTMRRIIALFGVVLIGAMASAWGDYNPDTIPGRWIAPLLPEKAPEPVYPVYDNTDLAKAADQAFVGEYRRALATLSTVHPTTGPAQVKFAVLKADCLHVTGHDQEAMAALADAAVAGEANVNIERGQILLDMDRAGDALAEFKKVVAERPDSIAGHYWLAVATEKCGDRDGALAAYNWFVEPPRDYLVKWSSSPQQFDDAAEATLMGRAFDRWASLTGAFEKDKGLHQAILNVFVRTYDVIDKDYWPAHVATAEYLMSHDDNKQAADELRSALGANPSCIPALRLAGLIATEERDFDRADSVVAAIRHVNPDSIDADIIEAKNLLKQLVPRQADKPIQAALAKQPHNVEALGLQAVEESMHLDDQRAAEILKVADQYHPNDPTAYLEMADELGFQRQYPRATANYMEALKRAPLNMRARNGLGLLYAQSGDEDNARTVLEAAHTLDPFNVEANNYLRLLDMMKKMSSKESAHFIVSYDAAADPLVPEYFNDYLETMYASVTADFKHEPAVKTMIEVFPAHDEFSVRTAGTPSVGTVGATMGRVIALEAPRKSGQTMGTFNWTQVLRHEFTHVVNLSMTENRIPIWLTEGLAVQEEHAPLQWVWVPLLYTAVHDHQLFNINDLTWGFWRPRKPTDRNLAYAESFWICQYLEETYGHDAILKLIEQFHQGHDAGEAFTAVLNKSSDAFFAEFSAWAGKQVAGWGYDAETMKKFELAKAQAQALQDANEYVKAAAAWEQAAALHPMDELPHQRLAGLYLSKVPNPQKAAEQLEILAKVDVYSNSVAKVAAARFDQLNELPLAIEYARKAMYTDLYDAAAHEELAGLYKKSGDQADADKETRIEKLVNDFNDRQRREQAATQPS